MLADCIDLGVIHEVETSEETRTKLSTGCNADALEAHVKDANTQDDERNVSYIGCKATEHHHSVTFKLITVNGIVHAKPVQDAPWQTVVNILHSKHDNFRRLSHGGQNLVAQAKRYQQKQGCNASDHILSMQVDSCQSIVLCAIRLANDCLQR